MAVVVKKKRKTTQNCLLALLCRKDIDGCWFEEEVFGKGEEQMMLPKKREKCGKVSPKYFGYVFI